MTQYVVNSEMLLSKLIGDVREQFAAHHYLRVTLRTGKDRSLDQNAVTHAWYSQVAEELREDDTLGVKRYCKLTIGVPILRAEDPEFREMYDATFKKLTYPQKLKAMDFLDVTSIMSVKQLGAYMVEMQEHYLTRGVVLIVKETEKHKAKARAA